MELKIQISDDVSFASSLGAILSSLSEEQKTKLAADMLRQFLTEPVDGERKAFESKLIAEIGRLSGDGYTTARYSSKAYASMSADEIRGTRDFSARMDRFVSVKETMIAQVTAHLWSAKLIRGKGTSQAADIDRDKLRTERKGNAATVVTALIILTVVCACTRAEIG